VRIFNRDLEHAGIPKRDERGRTLDVHALRMTFGTLLSRGGVPLRTAQSAMRHSDPKLTAIVYTDPKLLDVFGALDALPSLALTAKPTEATERVRAVGTYGRCAVALPVALASDESRQSLSNDGNSSTSEPRNAIAGPIAVTSVASGDFRTPIGLAAGGGEVCPAGLEPATFSSGAKRCGRDKGRLMQGGCREVGMAPGIGEESGWHLECSCRGVA
jgi:hypothetical protein